MRRADYQDVTVHVLREIEIPVTVRVYARGPGDRYGDPPQPPEEAHGEIVRIDYPTAIRAMAGELTDAEEKDAIDEAMVEADFADEPQPDEQDRMEAYP